MVLKNLINWITGTVLIKGKKMKIIDLKDLLINQVSAYLYIADIMMRLVANKYIIKGTYNVHSMVKWPISTLKFQRLKKKVHINLKQAK